MLRAEVSATPTPCEMRLMYDVGTHPLTFENLTGHMISMGSAVPLKA